MMMSTIHSRYNQHIRPGSLHHLFKIRISRTGSPDNLLTGFHTTFILIAKTYKLNVVRITFH